MGKLKTGTKKTIKGTMLSEQKQPKKLRRPFNPRREVEVTTRLSKRDSKSQGDEDEETGGGGGGGVGDGGGVKK